MSKNTNKCFFTGRLGRDPESRTMPSGDAIVTFSIGVSDDYKDRASGQTVEKTEWVNLKATGKLGEICQRFLKKGSKILVEAKFETRKYTGKDSIERTVAEFLIRDMEMLDSKPSNTEQWQGPPAGQGQPAPQRSRPMPNTHRAPAGDLDDDLPF
jgi:single-strand DNA-binding protein